MKALIIDRVSPLVESGLKEYGVDVDVKILPGVDELKRLLPEYDLLVMRVDPKLDRELLDAAAKRVKMIAVCSAGTNHIDLAYAKELGIRIQNAPGINCNAVAELTISSCWTCPASPWRPTGRCSRTTSGTSISTQAMS